jgi:hypothetical protein
VQDGGMGSCAGTLDQLIDTYCAAWSDPDPMRRREILERVWADGATYTDLRVHAVELSADGRIQRVIGFFGPLTVN